MCPVCGKKFHGEYARGNCARHKRQKHSMEGEQHFLCKYLSCQKSFNRQDARLKHYRRSHPELELKPPRGRKPDSPNSVNYTATSDLFTSNYVTDPVPSLQMTSTERAYDSLPAPAEVSIMASSDSGYASLGHGTRGHLSRQGRADNAADTSKTYIGASGEMNNSTSHVYETKEDCDDSKTVYSHVSSTTGSREETYISELVEDLSKCMPATPRAGDDEVMERLYSMLPGLLKSFARKIGHSGQCRESRAIMVFVSKRRQYVLSIFNPVYIMTFRLHGQDIYILS